jgi:hypothetical protein
MLTKVYNGSQKTCNFQFARTFKKDGLTEGPRQTTTTQRRRRRRRRQASSSVSINSDTLRRPSLFDTWFRRPSLPMLTPPPYQEFEDEDSDDMEEEVNAQNLTTTADEFFVESAALTINGHNITSLGLDVGTADFDSEKFIQFMTVAGSYCGTMSSGLTEQDFMSNYFFLGYDTSASGHAYMTELAHTARTGSYQFRFRFNIPSLEPVTLLYFAEYEGSIIMNKEGKVTRSYVI